jgi:hypothetical protein
VRKVIQIQATATCLPNDYVCDCVFALCNDGSILCTEKISGHSSTWSMWEELPPIPQPEEENAS